MPTNRIYSALRDTTTVNPLVDPNLVQQQNQISYAWATEVNKSLRGSAYWFSDGKLSSTAIRNGGKQLEKKLAESINSQVTRVYGLVSYIGFRFERHGVFVHKGVGRGYQKQKGGFVIRTAKRSPHPHERIAVEWFNPILELKIPQLADQIALINTQAAVNATQMKIK